MATDDSRESILGTLRSEFDDDDSTLHAEFETLATLIGAARSAFLSFRLTPEQAASICAGLRLVGSDGNEWTVGVASGAWFRRRQGDPAWTKTVMPLDVSPVYTQRPLWIQEGIGSQLLAAEQQIRDQGRSAADETSDERGIINPFQRKDAEYDSTTAMTPRSNAAPRAMQTDDNSDWLFAEWDELERGRSEQRPSLPAVLPEELQADRSLAAAISNVDGPVERAGSDHDADAPVDRGSVSPEDFFLPPEE
jgi:hypothetical protein